MQPGLGNKKPKVLHLILGLSGTRRALSAIRELTLLELVVMERFQEAPRIYPVYERYLAENDLGAGRNSVFISDDVSPVRGPCS